QRGKIRLAALRRAGKLQVNLAIFQPHSHHLYPHLVTKTETDRRAPTDETMLGGDLVAVVATERGNADQPLNVDIRQHDKETKRRHRSDNAVVFLTHMILEEFALEPCQDIAGGIVGPPLGHRDMLAQL